MFLLDTSVLSAIMARKPVPQVARWIVEQSIGSLFTASVCQAEILAGIAVLPEGRRRTSLQSAARRQSGRPIGTADPMIASIARVRGAAVVTRDIGGFEGCGLSLINPWEGPSQ